MSVWAIVPVKSLQAAKSRLSEVLTPAARQNLTERVLKHVLGQLKQVPAIDHIVVVTPDPQVQAWVDAAGCICLKELGSDGLNAAVAQSLQHVQAQGARTALVIPADLPMLTAADVSRMIAAHQDDDATLTICPDRHERGTNALLLTPPMLIMPVFGENSLELHVQAGQQVHARVQEFHAPTVMLDVDTAHDLSLMERELMWQGRRSVRRYQAGSVRRATLERVLAAAAWAPSAHNRQPWRFTVLTSDDARSRLANAMGARLRTDRLADGVALHKVEADVKRSAARITEAPALVVVSMTLRDMDQYPDARRSMAERTMATQSVAMAVQNLLLAAHSEGLGACWMCAPLFCQDVVREALGLPDDCEPQALITLGEPADNGKPATRKALIEVVKWL